MRNAPPIVLFSALLMSCVSTATTMLNPASRRPPVTPDKVVIYTAADKVPGKYEEVAILTSQGDYTVAGDDKFYESFRQEAAKVGANGVIISPIEDPTTGQKVGSAVLGALLIPNTMGNRKTQAIAIYVFPVPRSAEEIAAAEALSASRAQKIAALESVVRPGMTRDEMVAMVGPPTKSDIQIDASNHSKETAIYTSDTGATFVVTLKNNKVENVVRK